MAPDTPTVSVATNPNNYEALDVTWGTASYGTPSTGTSYIYRGTSASPTFLMYSKTAVGTILWTNTGCTPNTRYYYRARAKNDADLWSSYSADSDAVTLARPANVSIANTTDTSITISYSTYADGGEYDKDIQYSIDGGTTWVTGDTVTGGSVATGTFTISGLTAHTSYTIRTRVSTTAGTSNGTTLSAIATHVRLYGSVNSETKRTKKLYGSLELLQSFTATGQSTAGSVSGFFYPVTFVPKLLATNSNLLVKGLVDFSTCKIKMVRQAITGNTSVSYYDSTTDPVTEIPIVSGTPSVVETYGIHLAGAGTMEYTVTDAVYAPVTKKIKKLYGSVDTIHNVELKGDTYQHSTTGKNLMPITSGTISEGGITITVADGIVTINGTSTSAGVIKLSNGLASAALIPSSWYNESVISDRNGKTFSIVKTSGTGPASATAFRIYRDNSNFEQWYPSVGGTQSFTDNYPILFLELFFNSGVTFTNAVYEIQLETGSKTAFEPYTAGPSPNPSYPQAVNVVTGDQTVTVTGKNLAYTGWGQDFVTRANNSQKANLQTEDGKSCVYWTATAGADMIVIPYKNNTQYTISFDIKPSVTHSNMCFLYTDGTTDGSRNNLTTGSWQNITMTSTAGKTVAAIKAINQNGNCYIDLGTVMLAEGSTATAYEPYQSQTYPLSLIGKNKFDPELLPASWSNTTPVYKILRLAPSTTYTISSNIPRNNGNALIFFLTTTDTINTNRNGVWEGQSRTLTTDATGNNIQLVYRSISGESYTRSNYTFQLEVGSSATTYEAFRSIELCKIGTYQDYIWKDGADWKVHKVVGKVVLTDTTPFASYPYGTNSYSTVISGMAKTPTNTKLVLSDYFYGVAYDDRTQSIQNMIYADGGQAGQLDIRNTNWASSSDLTTWLSTHNTTVYYVLATPTDTAITDATLISQLNALEGAVSPSKTPNVFVAGSLPATVIFDVDGATKLIYEG